MIKINSIGSYVRVVSGNNFAQVGRAIDDIIEKENPIAINEIEFSQEKDEEKIWASFIIKKASK